MHYRVSSPMADASGGSVSMVGERRGSNWPVFMSGRAASSINKPHAKSARVSVAEREGIRPRIDPGVQDN